MADVVSTTTTLTELVNAEYISDAILDYAVDFTVCAPYMRLQDLRGKATNTGSFPRWVLDTATDITNETTDLESVAIETTDTQIAGAEIGVNRDITDAAVEMSTIGAGIFNFLVQDAATLFAVSLDDDICALFPSISTTAGPGTGNNLVVESVVMALAGIRKQKMRGQAVVILDDQQAEDLQVDQIGHASTTVSSFFDVSPGIDNAYLGSFMGAPVYQTGLCDTVNTAADVCGAAFLRGDTNPRQAWGGMVLSRAMRVEVDRDIKQRQTFWVATAKWGVAEIAAESGIGIVSDA